MRIIFNVIIISFIIILLPFSPLNAANKDFIGKWEGSIEIQSNKLEIMINMADNSGLRGTLDIISQGVTGLSLKNIELNDNNISFEVLKLPGNAFFQGKLTGDTIKGKFKQFSQFFSFEVKRMTEKDIKDKEMIYATGEYKIKEKEVFISTEGGKIAATLTIPQGTAKPSKAIVLVAGSGPTDRDGNNPLIKVKVDTLKELAHYLSSNGIVTLRYDKRGIKGSSNIEQKTTSSFNMFKYDLDQVINYLKESKFINKKELYVLGHSEGAMLTIMSASDRNDLAGIILIAGAGFPHAKVLRSQIENYGKMYEVAGQKWIKKELLTALDDLYSAIRNDASFDIENYDIPDDLKVIYLSLANQKEFARDWLDLDPANLLKRVKTSVCIIQGTNDSRVSVDNAKNLASVVSKERLDLNIFEGINHFLKKADPGYINPSQRIERELLDTIYDFVMIF